MGFINHNYLAVDRINDLPRFCHILRSASWVLPGHIEWDIGRFLRRGYEDFAALGVGNGIVVLVQVEAIRGLSWGKILLKVEAL